MAEIVNLYRDRLPVINGTRIIEPDLNVIGHKVVDPHADSRVWEVHGLYWPVAGRTIGGIRAKLIDQKGFVTFCNQRDLEVLLGMARPGDYCAWAGQDYVAPDDEDWCGLCCDDEDLLDDLYDRELMWRAQTGGVLTPTIEVVLPSGETQVQYVEIKRGVHLEKSDDHEELFVLLGDFDQETGMYPDTRFETLERRWMRSERKRVRWNRC